MGEKPEERQHRLQVIFNSNDWARIDRLCELSESATKVDVIREAIRVYAHILEATLDGERLLLESSDGTQQSRILTTTIMVLQGLVKRGEADHLKRPPA